jgi:hypothetical protein
MPGFKLTTWNVEHADKTLSDFEGTGGHSTAASAERATDRAIARMAAIRSPGFMVESVRNRAKLSSEASDIRYYIDRRFAQEGDPAIFLVGDINDGPGKELIEDWYLLHDLIGNLQGEVFSAHKFLNHALFDIADDLRWTVHFEDAIDRRRDPHILLDHILFTQRLAGSGKPPLRVFPNAGRVEHDIHERVASTLPGGVTTSDHRPVSVYVTEVDQNGAPTGP